MRGCLVGGAVLLAVAAIVDVHWALWIAWAYLVGISAWDALSEQESP